MLMGSEFVRSSGTALLMSCLLAACGTVETSEAGDHADGAPPIRTSVERYTLQEQDGGLAVDIPIEFHNVTGERVYIVNCRDALAPVLEKRVNGAWQTFWQPPQLACLSDPIVIERGASLQRTIPVWGALPSGDVMPEFASDDIDGSYRIVLHNVVFNYHDARPAFRDPVPLEQRVSNTFELRR